MRNFYTAALNAGGRPNGAPAARCAEDGRFNAAVLDFDGNSIEVVCGDGPDMRDDGTVIEHSRVITWQRTVTGSFRDDRSLVSSYTSTSKSTATEVASKAATVVSQAPSVSRSISAPAAVPQVAPPSPTKNGAAVTLLGTLLGAAAGAAVAYAMVRSEQDSAKKEDDFGAFMKAKDTVRAAVGHLAQTTPQPQLPPADPQPAYEPAVPATPQSVHRNIDAQSYYSATPSEARTVVRQIEAAPPGYHSPLYSSGSPTLFEDPRLIEYLPASSVASSQARSRVSAHRSHTSPELLTIENARSTVSTLRPESVVSESRSRNGGYSDSRSEVSESRSRSGGQSDSRSVVSEARSRGGAQSVAHSTVSESRSRNGPQSVVSEARSRGGDKSVAHNVAHSVAPSSLISSFVPDHVERQSSAGSVVSHRSSRSKAKSSHSHASRHSSHSKHSSRRREDEDFTPSPVPIARVPPKVPSKAATLVSTILGRNAKLADAKLAAAAAAAAAAAKEKEEEEDDFIDDLDIDDLTDDDFGTVVPSDSVSNAGSSRRHRSHRSHKSSSKDKDSSEGSIISMQSSASKHSKRSHRSHKSGPHTSDDAADDEGSKPRRSTRPSVVSEVSDASTARPVKPPKPSSRVSTRKDSVTQGQYDNLFDEIRYGAGNVAVRGITPSMVSAAGKNTNRSMMTLNHAQKMRQFEGKAYDG